MDKVTLVGIGASILTACSLLPQLVKLMKEKKAEDLSLFMLGTLLGGLTLWIYYGVLTKDVIIVISNSFALLVNILTVGLTIYYKLHAKP